MRLERLEIAGFKSFSDRSELAFDRGVTAIVGPNGCGKSNVADAITWVLGEQSARSLRGDKMEDVIFSGSDGRRPTATAEVRLRLSGVTAPENGNGNGHTNGNGNGHADLLLPDTTAVDQEPPPIIREVELIRRLYRSGESEYLIDGEQCRLRDIHELLMDTGLGAKAYAIIEQGKIGMILSSRPTDRRQLIEEAAGITKYKARRRSAELKLEAAQQNLTRIDDIVFEVEKQRGSLKRQAAKARRHQRLRDELRRWEKVLYADRYHDLSAAIASTHERLTVAREREAGAAARVSGLEGELGRLRLEAAEADGRATSCRDRAHAQQLEIQRTEQQIELNRHQVAALGTRIEELVGEEATLSARRAPQQEQLAERRAATEAAVTARREAAARLEAENSRYQEAGQEVETLEADLERARSEVFASFNALTTLRHAIDQATAARERAQEGLSRLDVEEADLRVDAERLAGDRAGAEGGLAAATEALAAIRERRTELEQQLTTARAAHLDLTEQLRAREHDLAGLAARLRSLEELEAAREGFTDAARVLLAEANGTVAQEGAVADYLEVERSFERAVEAVLGELLQHVVVPTHAHAIAGVELLRDRDAGRCGFVVLDGPAPSPVALGDAGPDFKTLRSAVRVTGPHAAFLEDLLGEALIAPSLEAAIDVGRQANATVVTRTGEVVRGGRILVGGSRQEARGILGTKGEIQELRARLTDEREAVDVLRDRVAAAQSLVGETLEAIDRANGDLHGQEKAIVGFEALLARAGEEMTRLERKGDILTTERRRADEEILQLEGRRTEAHASINALEARQREADAAFEAAQRRLHDARERVEGISARAAEVRADHAALVERAAALAAEVERLEEATRDLEARVAALSMERVQKMEYRAGLEAETAAAVAGLDGAVERLEALRVEVRTADESAAEVKGRIDGLDSVIRDARTEHDADRATLSELEIARATAESDLSHLAASCAESVQATLDDVRAEVEQWRQEGGQALSIVAAGETDEGVDDADADESTADVDAAASTASAEATTEEAIARLRERIDRLGPVNMMAIEQFDELEERHQFLTTQRQDLIDSIAATNDAIRRIDETSRVRFREAFEAINRNFQDTFATLFGGGRAGITLLDDTDPLESGIDIVASPPGKRLQSVQLLSGGEKALAAIALMFAIFKYKPSPFCLLDEIDAPLDDANIGRFVEMLKGMLHHTQFILITHNRKTMEIADRLYGVTMEEPGVSKLISVRLN